MITRGFGRRTFILSGSAAATVATGGLGSSRRLFAQTSASGFDPQVLDTAIETHAAVVAKSYNGQGAPNDFLALSQAQVSVATTFQQNNFDNLLKAQIANITPDQLNPAANNYAVSVQRIQTYAPDFAVDDFKQLLTYLQTDPVSVANSLADLKQNGLSPTIQSTAVSYAKLQRALNLQQGDGKLEIPFPFKKQGSTRTQHSANGISKIQTAAYYPDRDRPHVQDVSWQRLMMTLAPSDGGSSTGYTCAADNMAGLAYGTAVMVVATMCFFSVIGDVLCIPVFAYWAATAGAGWGLAHAVKCGF